MARLKIRPLGDKVLVKVGDRSNLVGLIERLLVSAVVVFLLFGPYLAVLLQDLTRYLRMWTTIDSVLLLTSIFALAAIAAGVGEFVRWLRRPVVLRLYYHGFVLALGAALLANLAFHCHRPQGYHIGQEGMEMQTLWLALVALTAYYFARPGWRLVKLARAFALILSPAMLLIIWQVLAAPNYPSPRDEFPSADSVNQTLAQKEADGRDSPTGVGLIHALAARDAADTAGPIYIFIFDEWSYEYAFTDDRVREEFPNLANLCERACVFHDARAPGLYTTHSLPRFLLQSEAPVVMESSRVGLIRDEMFVPAEQCPGLFDQLAQGRRTCMVGFFLPFRAWLPRVDVVRSYRWYAQGENPASALAQHVYDAAYYWTDPWTLKLHRRSRILLMDRQVLWIYDRISEDIRTVIREQPAEMVAVFHYPLPHAPYIVDPDGQYRWPPQRQWAFADLQGYKRNLARLDRMLAEIFGHMQAAGRYEPATIVITSDHGWRYDPARKDAINSDVQAICADEPEPVDSHLSHVPLIIKFPHQQASQNIYEPVKTVELVHLLERGGS